MLMCKSRAWLEIDLTKIEHNVKEIEKLLPSTTKIMAIVKANAYGMGDLECAKKLQELGIDFFGVSSIDEAIRLRDTGIKEPILILGYTPPMHFHYLKEYDFIQTLISKDYADKLNAYAKEEDILIHAHVKVDTGMSRIGIQCKEECYEIEDVIQMYQYDHIQCDGIFSHFSVSDSHDEDDLHFTDKQIELFDRVLLDLKKAGINPGIRHLQNSYGILNYPNLNYDYVRPGLLYLGVTSDDTIEINTKPDFQPIMELKANVSLVKTIKKGTCVSYGRNYRCEEDRKIATVSIGYADGYPRIVSNKGMKALLHGVEVTNIGNVCMDQIMFDVTEVEDVKEGDVITLFGYDQDAFLSIDTLTRKAQTINNDMLCQISARVPRIYKK